MNDEAIEQNMLISSGFSLFLIIYRQFYRSNYDNLKVLLNIELKSASNSNGSRNTIHSIESSLTSK